MPVEALEFLRVAKRLLEGSPGEIDRRCSISRAYYAALHTLDLTLPAGAAGTGPGRADGESTHMVIIDRARQLGVSRLPGNSAAVQLARLMTKLRRSRNEADYDLKLTIGSRETEDFMARVDKALSLCDDVTRLRAKSGNLD